MIRPGLHTMMTDTSGTVQSIAEQLATLSKKLRNNTDPENGRALLREFRLLLKQAYEAISEEAVPD